MKPNKKNKIAWWKIAGSILLSLSMLAYSGSAAVFTMVCFSSGEQSVSLSEMDDCCTLAPVTGAMVNAKCCDFQKGEFSFFSLKTLQNELIPVVFTKPVDYSVHFAERLNHHAHQLQWPHINGPPESGRQLLTAICKYTI